MNLPGCPDSPVPDEPSDVAPTQRGVERADSKASEASKVAVRVFNVSVVVRLGGAVLGCCAGVVNAVAFKAFGTFVSHHTGSLSKVGLGWEDASVDAGDAALLILSFVTGACLCGFLVAHDTIHLGLALYDLCLLTEAALLVAVTLLAEHHVARYLATAACGLQNGLATHWGGAVIRTTHVTGLFTDVGLLIGRVLSMLVRKRCGRAFDDIDRAACADDVSKLSVLGTIATAYVVGIFLGAHLHAALGYHAFLIPAAVTGSVGFTYSCYRVAVLHQRLFSDEEMEIVDMEVESAPLQAAVAAVTDADAAEAGELTRSSSKRRSSSKMGVTEVEMDLSLGHRPLKSATSTSVVSVSRAAALAAGQESAARGGDSERLGILTSGGSSKHSLVSPR